MQKRHNVYSDEEFSEELDSEDSWSREGEQSDDSDRADADGLNDAVTLLQIPSDEDDDDVQDQEHDLVWGDTANLEIFPFLGNPGLRVAHPGNNPYDFFEMLFTDELLNHIVEQTNLFADKSTREKSRIVEWKILTVAELKIFLGIWFQMGNIRMNRLQDYWKKDELFAVPGLQKYMGRNRFMGIMRCLHFSPNPVNEDDAGYGDRLQKIRFLQDYLNNRMEEIYYPGKQLSLDESMLLWRGRLQFRQFMKGKKHKYGMKLYLLAQPNGMILRCNIYSGAQGELGGKGHAEKVVKSLMKGFENKGHSLYMDNYYNSVSLSQQLIQSKTYVTGTLRKGRKDTPQAVSTSKLKKGEVVTKYCKGVAVGKWRDKRDVLFLSTEFEEEMIEVRRKRGEVVVKPKAIAKYNEFMSGIDRQDQMLSYYACERKTLRWYKKLAIHLMSIMFLNSYLLFKECNNTRMNYYDFRIIVIKKLLSEKQLPAIQRPMAIEHLPTKLDRTHRRRCKVCSQRKIRQVTQYYCAACEGEPGLCLSQCFAEYHKH